MYSKASIILLLICNVSGYSYATEYYFRPDYHYIEATKAFYKFHAENETWTTAIRMCESEGASLFYPINKAEARAMVSFWKETQTLDWAYIGISDLVVNGIFTTFDGIPLANVYNDWYPGKPNDVSGTENCLIMSKDEGKLNVDSCTKKLPYICKKSLYALGFKKECNKPFGYQYIEEEGKCYKFHKQAMNWTDAYIACSGELSYLAVINSHRERDNLVYLARESNNQLTPALQRELRIHIGFHNRLGDGWKNLKGASVDDSDFSRWNLGQPADLPPEEKCGSIAYTGRLHDIGCHTKTFFICEHDVEPQLF